MKIQLIYFQGCPNVEPARAALRQAITAERADAPIEEIDVGGATAPTWARGWASPTILVDGTELTGLPPSSGAACRVYAGGAPTVDQIRARLRASRSAEAAGRRASLSMLGAITAALAASGCCLVPAVLGVVGVSGAGFGAALAPYRIDFLIATGLALCVAFWLVYRKRADACGCNAPRSRRAVRAALWVTAAVSIATAAYPLVGDASAVAGFGDAAAAATIRLEVRGMDCAACSSTIANRIKEVPGVVSASLDFDTRIAVVRHDGRDGIAAAAIDAVRDAGFTAQLAP